MRGIPGRRDCRVLPAVRPGGERLCFSAERHSAFTFLMTRLETQIAYFKQNGYIMSIYRKSQRIGPGPMGRNKRRGSHCQGKLVGRLCESQQVRHHHGEVEAVGRLELRFSDQPS